MKSKIIYALNGAIQMRLEDGRLLKIPAEHSKGVNKFMQHGDTGTLYNNERQEVKFMMDAEDVLYSMKIYDKIITQPEIITLEHIEPNE
jgi:hypothetical protein